MSENNKYNETILLPKTNFGMRGKLPTEELKTIEFWEKIELWKKLRKKSEGKEKFVLHDGPPYANGPIHMGTATNKILKDIINRTMQIEGYNVLYVPGWDCHGLPIEWQIEKNYRKKGKSKETISIKDFRSECRDFANKWIEIQKQSFIRLFVLADWDNPYLTMDYENEAIILKEFSKFYLKDRLYRGSKPVMWSPVEQTALAEAEIEYKDINSKSIYVSYEIKKGSSLISDDGSIVIWTTTPWTLPGSRAIAYGDNIRYVLIEIFESEYSNKEKSNIIIAEALLENIRTHCNIKEFNILKKLRGKDLQNIICKHPFSEQGYDYDIPLIEADFVDEKEGTGFVHMAPSYGEDDYYLAKKNNIVVEDIVKDDGCYRDNTPIFAGIHVFKAHNSVIEKLLEVKKLLGVREYTHSYPHSWRSKKPIIFRTTPQWFISMEKNNLKEKAIDSIEETSWIPAVAKNRIKTMVENRPDWCVSRQRAWGVPLTIFVNKKTGEPLRDEKVMERIIEDVKLRGSDVWLSEDPYKYLGDDKDPNDYYAVKDILDVWFDSGSSHAYVLEKEELKWPADLYLEGTDQHRGFFQSSLLVACGTRGKAPYKTVITHGFVLDGNGRKMSKSSGNVVNPEDIIKKSGVDVLRLWVATTDYSDDMRIGEEILSNLNDNYRRIRNTFRFILGNIGKIKYKDCIEYAELQDIDKFVLARIYELNDLRLNSIKKYSFHNFYKDLFEFCSVDLSAFYFDISKDILYCNREHDIVRRVKTTVLLHIYEFLTTCYAPVLCHTMEEVWNSFKTENLESIHFKIAKKVNKKWKNESLIKEWSMIKSIRKAVNTAIEKARNDKIIGSSLETEVQIYAKDSRFLEVIKNVNMQDICIVSNFEVINTKEKIISNSIANHTTNNKELEIFIFKTKNKKCLRCWQYKKEVEANKNLCDRCKKVIKAESL